MRIWVITALLFLTVPSSFAGTDTETYGYPLTNPYVATVVGTPGELRAPLPNEINIKHLELTVFKDREAPDALWQFEPLRYSLAYQTQKAPLVFAISGTGSSASSHGMQVIQKALFQAGFHVISLPSPTHPNFITAASSTSVPGHTVVDSNDLYRVMQLAWEQVHDDIEVTDFHLIGYSLGAAQAAFVAKIDEKKGVFNFKKVLMINPPVSLYSSAAILDRLLVQNIGGIENLDDFIKQIINKLIKIYSSLDLHGISGQIEFNGDFLYQAYQKYAPNIETLAALIGLSFRWSAANMVFTSDVITDSGYVKPENVTLSTTDSLTPYFKESMRISFLEYFDEYLFPYYEARYPSLTRKQFIHSISLKSIEEYLRQADKIALMTNEDDPILAPGELEYLRDIFQSRAKIYPEGGHLGNIAYKENVAHMVNFFLN